MQVIDDDGRLFGLVNVIDALVVVLILVVAAVVVATVLGPGADGGGTTNYATIEYTAPTGVPGALLTPGETLTPARGGDEFVVESAHYSHRPNGSIHVTARVSHPGTATIGGDNVSTWARYELATEGQSRPIRFVGLGESGPDLQTAEQQVVLAVPQDGVVSQAVEPGDEATVGSQTVARVESVRRLEPGTESRAELVGVTLTVLRRADRHWFGGRAIRINQELTVVTDDVIVSGRIYRIGTANTRPE